MDIYDRAAVRLAAWLRHLDAAGGLSASVCCGGRGEYALLSAAASEAAVVGIDDLSLPVRPALLWPRELHWLAAVPFDVAAWVREGLFIIASGAAQPFGFGVTFSGPTADIWPAAGDSMTFGTYTKGTHTRGRLAWRRTSQGSLIVSPSMPLIAVLESLEDARALTLKESRHAGTAHR